MRKEINNFLIIPNDNKINEYNSNSFIFPLKDFSVGFECYFDISEINKYSSVYETSVIINKFLHKNELAKITNIIKELKNIKYIFVEDVSLINLIPNEKAVFYSNHVLNNYNAINYLSELGVKNVVVSNELTITELKEIEKNTKSHIFYKYFGFNNIMYSKRQLLTNYNNYYNINSTENLLELNEEVSKYKLFLFEEEKSSCIFNGKLFCASKYLNDLLSFNKIIDFSHVDDNTKKIVLNNLNNQDLYKLIDCDYYFLENSIMYKVGDLS